MKTIPSIPIDEQMGQIIERANQVEYEKFVQAGIAEWHRERAEQKTADGSREPATVSPVAEP
jgi:hypothetical protein